MRLISPLSSTAISRTNSTQVALPRLSSAPRKAGRVNVEGGQRGRKVQEAERDKGGMREAGAEREEESGEWEEL
jgi:hypothetical protein